MVKETLRTAVRRALEELCKERQQRFAGDYPFFTARTVAERAECSVSTAHKHLKDLAWYEGYERRKVGRGRGIWVGYRITPYSNRAKYLKTYD